jgi:large subunit ribosomal protein L30
LTPAQRPGSVWYCTNIAVLLQRLLGPFGRPVFSSIVSAQVAWTARPGLRRVKFNDAVLACMPAQRGLGRGGRVQNDTRPTFQNIGSVQIRYGKRCESARRAHRRRVSRTALQARRGLRAAVWAVGHRHEAMSVPVILRQELLRTRLAVTLVRSTIGRPESQRKIVQVLGLKKLRQTRRHSDGPRVWGLIEKVTHLVHVERVPATAEEQLAAEARAAAPPSPQTPPAQLHRAWSSGEARERASRSGL